MESPAYSWENTSKKIATGAGIAMAGTLATYMLEVIPTIDFGTYTGLVVAINSIIANAIRNYIKAY